MIGERLTRARIASDLSMKALGEAAGVSANMIQKYEHNDSMPSSGVLIKLSKALQVRSEYFFRSSTIELSAAVHSKPSNHMAVLDQAERWEEFRHLWPNAPLPLPPLHQANTPEETELFQRLVYRALEEGIIGESKAAELLGISLMKFHQGRKLMELAQEL